jgi:hypothetical protein
MKFSSWTYDGHEVDLQHICDEHAVYLEATKEKVINRGIDIKDFYPAFIYHRRFPNYPSVKMNCSFSQQCYNKITISTVNE